MITLLHLHIVDKCFIAYFFILGCVWLFNVLFNEDKPKPNNVNTVVTNNTVNIQTNIYTSVKIWINAIEKLITDDNVGKPGVSILPKSYELNCTKIEYVRSVIRWCRTNIDNNSKRKITLDLKYTASKKLMGSYHYATRCILIYYGSHKTIESLTDTIIHEYSHAINILNSKHQGEYDKLTKQRGYRDNPHEVLARETAAKHRIACIVDLYKLKLLK